MALDNSFSSNNEKAGVNAPVDSSSSNKEPNVFDHHHRPSDLENQTGRRKSLTLNPTDSDSEILSVNKQIELEQGNAIQYRTCSWKKVWFFFFVVDGVM